MGNTEIEEDDNSFLDHELSELNKVIQSANELVQQMGNGVNPLVQHLQQLRCGQRGHKYYPAHKKYRFQTKEE